MAQAPIEPGAQVEGTAPQARTLDAMLEAMRNAPAPDLQRAPQAIRVRPTMPPAGSDASGDSDRPPVDPASGGPA